MLKRPMPSRKKPVTLNRLRTPNDRREQLACQNCARPRKALEDVLEYCEMLEPKHAGSVEWKIQEVAMKALAAAKAQLDGSETGRD